MNGGNWSRPISDDKWTNGNNFTITAFAKDNAENTETPGPIRTFLFDNQVPTSVILIPVDNGTYSVLNTITGTATDNASGVKNIKVSINNVTDTTYWAGTGWASAETYMLASGTTNWYFTSPEWTTPKNYLIKSKSRR